MFKSPKEWIIGLFGVAFIQSLWGGIKLHLATKDIYPEKWFAAMIGYAESALVQEAFFWIMFGVLGFVGLFVANPVYEFGRNLFRKLQNNSEPNSNMPMQSNSQNDSVVHNYKDCVVHHYPDGTTKSEPKKITNTPVLTETFVAIAIPSLEILASYNVSAIADNGVGEYTIHFDNSLTGYYTINVSSDENVEYKVEVKCADCAKIKFFDEKPNTLNIEFKKVRE